MSNVYQRIVDLSGSGTGGGGGALIVATRSDNNNPAVFTNFAALETYTATSDGTTDANRINVTDADDAREVFAVGTLDGSNNVTGITAAYIRLNGAWVSVATNLVGTPGTDGDPGLDGSTFEFVNATERDAFFQARPDLLKTGLPIVLSIDSSTVMNQIWNGATAPSSYTPLTDARLWEDASIRTSTSSFELGGIHSMSSGGENVFFVNQNSDVSYAPPWQSLGNHTDPAGRIVDARPVARDYGTLTTSDQTDPVATSGAS